MNDGRMKAIEDQISELVEDVMSGVRALREYILVVKEHHIGYEGADNVLEFSRRALVNLEDGLDNFKSDRITPSEGK